MGSTTREPKLRQFDFDQDKFKELILYISACCQSDPTYDMVKLNTVLYYADFAAYRTFGKPISGATYEKYDAGPTPRQMPEIRRELIDACDAQLVERSHFLGGHLQLVPSASGSPNVEQFNPHERELIDSIIEFFTGKSSRETSDFARREPGWALARKHEAIPYASGWLQPAPLSPDAEAAALRFAREHGYLSA